MGFLDTVKGALFEGQQPSSNAPDTTKQSPPNITYPKTTIPAVPSSYSNYPSTNSTQGPYTELLKTLDSVVHPGNAFFSMLEKLTEEIGDENARYRLALKLSGVSAAQIRDAVNARRARLQGEIDAFNKRYAETYTREVTSRDTKLSTIRQQISNLQSQIASLESQTQSASIEREQKDFELNSKKSAFDFAAAAAEETLKQVEQTLNTYLT